MSSLFLRKSIASADANSGALRRVLGPIQLTLFGVGAIVGTGIFVLTGTAAAGEVNAAGEVIRLGAGPALIVSFVLTAFACGFAALCYAELASMIPVAGSAYTYAYAAFGELIAWIIGWDLVLEYAVGNVAVAIGWSAYLQGLLGQVGLPLPMWLGVDPMTASRTPELFAAGPHLFGHPITFNLPAMLIVAAVTVLLIVGVRESARANAILVLLKLAMIALFVIVGVGHIDPVNWHPFAPNGFRGIMTGAALIFFAYIGFDAVSTTAEETRNPQRDLPIGMIASLVVCTILYIGVTVVLTGMLPTSRLATAEPVAVALRAVGEPHIASIISAGAVIAITSVLIVFQLGQTRIFYAMSRDGLLPKVFRAVNPRFRTPVASTIITGLVVGIPAGFIDIASAADLTNIGTLFAFIIVSAGVVSLRRTDPHATRPFRVPLVPITPIIAIVFCLALMVSLPTVTWVRFVVWLVVGLALYFGFGYRHSVARAAAQLTQNQVN
ncbi:MAG: amino acid permease [Bacteroidetes bacterium]|nr:amino acid permease [Bacteroidota bacterium]